MLHPEPIFNFDDVSNDHDNDNDDNRSETTASSILSYFSHRSAHESEHVDGPILNGMKNIGKSVRNLFGKKTQSQSQSHKKDLEKTKSVKGALENIEADDVINSNENKNDDDDDDAVDENKSINSQFQYNNNNNNNNKSKDIELPQKQQKQQQNIESIEDNCFNQQTKISLSPSPSPSLSSQLPYPRSLLMRRKPNSNLSLNISLKSFETNNDNDNDNDNDEEIKNERNERPNHLLNNQESGEYDSIGEFPVLILSELSPSQMSEHKVPYNQHSFCDSLSSPFSTSCKNNNDNISTNKLLSNNPTTEIISPNITAIDENSNMNCEMNKKEVKTHQRIEHDVLAFVFGIENQSSSICSEDESKDNSNCNHQSCEEGKVNDNDQFSSQTTTITTSNNNNNNNSNEKNIESHEPQLISQSLVSPKNLIQQNQNDQISFSSPSTLTLTSIAISTPSKVQLSSKSSLNNNNDHNNNHNHNNNSNHSSPTNSLPKGWEECYTPKGKLFFINHNDKTTHWHLPNV